MPDRFVLNTLATIKKYHMLKAHDKVLVGFSGGPDSMALLHILHQLKDKLRIKLFALHVNHQLRKKDADKDEKFCLAVCKKMAVPIQTCKINLRDYAQKSKMSTEEAARSLRYQELLKRSAKMRCTKIALGHNANDNCETVIFHLCRGAGLAGLAGIPPVRTNIIRPLIETDRNDIISYLKTHKLQYCQDLTNIEIGYRRNYIRHKIIPLLLSINPNLVKTILRTSEILRDTNNGIMQITEQAFDDVLCRPKTTQCRQNTVKLTEHYGIDTKKLLSYNLLIRREIIKKIIPRLDFDSINRVLALAHKPSGKSVEINNDYIVWKEYDKLTIVRHKPIPVTTDKQWPLQLNQETRIPTLNLRLSCRARKATSRIKIKQIDDKHYALFDKDKLALPMYIRLRKQADRFTPYHGSTMKLKDLFINDRVPLRLRDRLPILCDQKNILWVIGSRRSNIGLIDSKTKEIIEVKVLN